MNSFHLLGACISRNSLNLKILDFISLICDGQLPSNHMAQERKHNFVFFICLAIHAKQLVNSHI